MEMHAFQKIMPMENVHKGDIPPGRVIETFHFTSYQEAKLMGRSKCSVLNISKC